MGQRIVVPETLTIALDSNDTLTGSEMPSAVTMPTLKSWYLVSSTNANANNMMKNARSRVMASA